MTYIHIYVILITSAAVMAGYAGSVTRNGVGGSDGRSSGGYGYSFSGGGSGSSPGAFPHQFYQQIPFDFNNFLAGYLDAFKTQQDNLFSNTYAYTSVSLDPLFQGTVSARSSISFAGLKQIQTKIQSGATFPGGYGGGFAVYNGQPFPSSGAGAGSYSGYGDQGGYPPVNNYAPSYDPQISYAPPGETSHSGGYGPGGYGAGASASIGGGELHQTAYLNPENPESPNVDLKSRNGNPENGGTYSIFTSSSSGFGNIDDKPVHFRHASTTVNDNGKVTTYTVRDKK